MSLATIACLPEYGSKFTLNPVGISKKDFFLYTQRSKLGKSIRLFEEYFPAIEFGPCFMLKKEYWCYNDLFQSSLRV